MTCLRSYNALRMSVCLVALALLLTWAPKTMAAGGPVITIGASVSLSGEHAEPSTEQFNGLLLWQAQVNANGGIQVGEERRPVRIVHYDDGSDASRIPGIYERLIHDDGADFLFSPYTSSLGAEVAAVADRHGVIALLPGSASEEIFSRGYTSVYQLYPPGTSYFSEVVETVHARDPGAKVAFLYKNDPFSRSTVAGARDLAQRLGLEIVYDRAYAPDAVDFDPWVSELLATGPDVLIGGGHVIDGTAIRLALVDAGARLDLIVLLASPALPEFAELGEVAIGVVYPSAWEPGTSIRPTYGPSSEAFVASYVDMYGREPQYFAASGYNAGLVLQQAIEAAGSLDSDRVHIALDHTDIVTFYGHIKFATDLRQHGLQIGHTSVTVQWQRDAEGRPIKRIVAPSGAATASLQYGGEPQ